MLTKQILIAVFFALAWTSVQAETLHPEKVVVGGRPVSPEERLSRVNVRLMRWGEFRCSGTLVAPDLVLTAAHCVQGLTQNEMRGFFVGFWDFSYIGVTSFRAHPRHVREPLWWGLRGHLQYHDLALLKLEQSAPAGAEIAYLPTGSLFEIKEMEMLLSGFGRTGSRETKSSGVLRVGSTKVTRRWQDQTKPPHLYASGVRACQGDSGGPLLLMSGNRFVVMGVHSTGNCDSPGGVSRSEDVHSHIDWINQMAVELRQERTL